MDPLRYPIGPYSHEGAASAADLERWVGEIEALPAKLRLAVSPLTREQLDTRYRPEGWTLRQVVHHVPESHLNGYVRFKWALTEESPEIKIYHEDRWAELGDYRVVTVDSSLALLTAVHERWVGLLRTLSAADWSRTFQHPEWGVTTLGWAAGLYAWHGHHHLAHITSTVERNGW